MSPFQDELPPPGSVRLDGANRATEIFLIDSTFALRRRAVGRLEGEFPAGIYKVRYQLGSEFYDEHFELRPGEREVRRGKPVIARSPSPLPSTGPRRGRHDVEEMDPAVRRRWWARAGEARPAPGEGVLHLVLNAKKPHPSYEVRVHPLGKPEEAVVAGWSEGGVEPRVLRRPAGTFVLSVSDGDGRLCRAVPVCRGHQTVVSLEAPPPRRGMAGALADSSLLLLPHPIDGDDQALLLQELAQQALRRSRVYLEPSALAGRRGASAWLRLLATHGVIEAARAGARRPYDPVELPAPARSAVIAAHRALGETALGDTADVAALGLFEERSTRLVDLDVPPILAATWRTLVARSLDRHQSFRGGDRLLHMAAQLRTSSLWFLWWERDERTASAGDRLDLGTSVEQLLEPRSRARAGRLPSWTERRSGLAELSAANAQMLARRLHLPIPLVLMLGKQKEHANLLAAEGRVERRREALASGAPIALVALPDGVRVDPRHGQTLDLEAVFDVVDRALADQGVVAVRAPPVVTGSKEMEEALAHADLLVAETGDPDPVAAAVAEAWLAHRRDAGLPPALIALRAKGLPGALTGGARLVEYRTSFGTSVTLAGSDQLARALQAIAPAPAPGPERDRWLQEVIQGEERQLQLRQLRARLGPTSAPLSRFLSEEGFQASLDREPAAVQRDVFLLLRSCSDWDGMVRAERTMAPALQKTVLVREQLALALNRSGRWEKAVALLESVLEEIDENGETCGLLGRIHKDRWLEAGRGRSGAARRALERAIEWYRLGVKASPKDPYPGVNALTLLAALGTPEARRRHGRLLPEVEAAAGRRLEARPSYWDLASMLEVAANKRSQGECAFFLRLALAAPHDAWQRETTARNLSILRGAPGADFRRAARWLESIERDLARGPTPPAAQSG